VFEGVDGVGKTTQSLKLVEWMTANGRPARYMRFPNRSSITGQIINDYLTNAKQLDDRVIHLLFSANRWEQVQEINDLLSSGISVVCDRWTYSGLAYSLAKGLSRDWCEACDAGLPIPSKVIYLHLDPTISCNRLPTSHEKYETYEFQCKVAIQYGAIKKDNWSIIDANQPINDVAQSIIDIMG